MSGFRVTPEAVSEIGARLGGISPSVSELHGRISGHVDAAHGTPAAGAVGRSMGRWSRALPEFALAGERLAAAVAHAAAGYRRSDQAVGHACEPGESG